MVIYAVCIVCAAVRLFPQIFLYSTFFFHWIGSFIVCLQTGGMRILKMFSTTLKTISRQNVKEKETASFRIAKPAATKIMTSNEIKSRAKDFSTRLSLFDTGTDAYLRQDNSLMSTSLPSSTVIHTAGPENLTATQTGLLHLLVKDDKGNMHQLMLENALVVPGLSQNLTSHKQFVENGHGIFSQKSIRNCTQQAAKI